MFRLTARVALRSSPFLPRCTPTTLNPIPSPTPHLPFLRPLSSSGASDAELRKYAGYFVLIFGCGAATYYSFPFSADAKHKKAQIFRYAPLSDDLHTVSNWSGTHEVHTRVFLQPETLADLEAAVRDAQQSCRRIRPVGSGLSPNGLGLAKSGMVNLALMDKVLEVDREAKRVTVQAGIRVSQLVDALKEHGLTLQNFASIREQQIGGILQVGAHGTGARLPPIDEQVISMKLVTPMKGTIEVSKEKNPELFFLSRYHVMKVNQAEAEYWKKSEGYRVGWSDEILGFDCGGQQWVSETCFPAGTLKMPNMKDLDYIEALKQLIEQEDIPAPAPIEQQAFEEDEGVGPQATFQCYPCYPDAPTSTAPRKEAPAPAASRKEALALIVIRKEAPPEVPHEEGSSRHRDKACHDLGP
ncbi:hypothetical protein B296_00013971 [Ensete ventricosum]|uniref:FAD-binding PCMH-type domain-containing protein n=1 Tax=Ensete ventricosum TaxID=4639 RepID=A0A427A611_ENSVE|nr:hypothetical protein B296_00013971 [Ensete ventricosum]